MAGAYGLSTRAVSTPVGTAGQFAANRPPERFVPLSAFFLAMQGDGEKDEDGLYGYRKRRKRKGRQEPPDKSKRPQKAGGRQDAVPDNVQGGGADQVDKGQSTAGTSEAVTMSPGGVTRGPSRPGAPSKLGVTHAMIGATGTGNVAQYPVPIGPPLLRVVPMIAGGKKKRRKKRRRKAEEDRASWTQRLGQLIES